MLPLYISHGFRHQMLIIAGDSLELIWFFSLLFWYRPICLRKIKDNCIHFLSTQWKSHLIVIYAWVYLLTCSLLQAFSIISFKIVLATWWWGLTISTSTILQALLTLFAINACPAFATPLTFLAVSTVDAGSACGFVVGGDWLRFLYIRVHRRILPIDLLYDFLNLQICLGFFDDRGWVRGGWLLAWLCNFDIVHLKNLLLFTDGQTLAWRVLGADADGFRSHLQRRLWWFFC